jgi:transposase
MRRDRRGNARGKSTTGKAAFVPVKVDEHYFDHMDVVHRDVAGIDIGSQEHYVAIPEDRDEMPVRKFGCYTPDLEAMADWLAARNVRYVVMESTGVYWIPTYQILSSRGFDVKLVDARHAKNVPGRKTDVWDCRWLRKLHAFGLLNGCFMPPPEIGPLRSYWRWRAGLVEACSQQIHLMQKALEQMNVQLHKVLSDITGVTGMTMLRAIVRGEHDPLTLARMKHPQVKKSDEEIAKALTGDYRPEHLFTLRQALETYDFYQHQVRECDQQIQKYMEGLNSKKDTDSSSGSANPSEANGTTATRRKNQPHFDLRAELTRITGVDLTRIDGIEAMTAQTVISEIGTDVSAFPTHKHFTSWLCLCPNHRITGGRVRSRKTRRSQNRVAHALRIAAQSLHRSKSALGAFFRRIKARHGAPKAITATAHKLARLIYAMLKHGQAYVDQGQQAYEQQYQERAVKALRKHAESMGYTLVETATGALVS